MNKSVQIDAMSHNGPYRTRNRLTVANVTGAPVVELSIIPRGFVRRSIAALRSRSVDGLRHWTFGGLSADDYPQLTGRVSDLPISAIRHRSLWLWPLAWRRCRACRRVMRRRFFRRNRLRRRKPSINSCWPARRIVSLGWAVAASSTKLIDRCRRFDYA